MSPSPSELEKLLWKSARTELPPEGGAERLAAALTSRLEALGANTATASPSAAPQMTTPKTFATWKLVVSAIAIAAPLGAFTAFRSEVPVAPAAAPAPAAPVAPRESEGTKAAGPASSISVLSIEDLPPARTTPAPSLGGRRATGAPSAKPAKARAAAEAVATNAPLPARASDLDAEVAALDEVRQKLRDGAPSRASALLDEYEARFPRGLLRPEAKVLQIEAATASGDKARARGLALAFLEQYPKHAHAERIRQLESQLRTP